MKIRMLSTQRGAEDGVTVRTYEAGAEFELSETLRGQDLAAVFLREGWAENASAPPELAEETAPAAVPEVTAEARPSASRKKPRGA